MTRARRRLVSLALACALVAVVFPHPAEAKGGFKLLATGDSMIQIIDSFLKERLGPRGVRVKSDAKISTGISKPFMLDWVRHARGQVARLHPDATVVFIGANDGFPIGKADCCGSAWIAGYAARAKRMMRAYARGGEGRVYWLLLPAPRGGNFRKVFPAVNAALRRAAAGERDTRLIHLERIFTPDGRFHPVIRYRGHLVHARQSDGVHLSRSGASLAASVVIRALVADGSWARLDRPGHRAPRERVVPRRGS